MNASENQIVVYQPNETVRLDVRLENETVWLTQAQLSDEGGGMMGQLENWQHWNWQHFHIGNIKHGPWSQVLCGRNPPHQEVGVWGGESEGEAMIDDTINDGKTIAGGGKDVVLAGRYHIIRRLG